MRIASKTASLVYKVALAALGTAALLAQAGVFSGTIDPSFFHMFTHISNIAVVAYLWCAGFVLAAGHVSAGTPWLAPVKHALMLAIMVTCLIAHFMLNGGMVFVGGKFFWTMLVMHYVVPLGMVADWLLFDDKGTMTWKEPPAWTLFPLAYVALVFAAVLGFGASFGASGTGDAALDATGFGNSRWPYPFLNIDALGVPAVLGFIAAMVVAFVALGYVFVAVDRVLARRRAV